MKHRKVVRLLVILTMVLSGCGTPSSVHEHHSIHHAVNGDLREHTASLTTLPSFLDQQSETIRNAYVIAALNKDDLDWIPCYCGCGETAGHKSSAHCFIHETSDDGSVVWDDHGTRCGVCIQIAVESALLKKDGHTLKDIRTAIDDKYRAGYGTPTPTPMPPH